jgi:acylphosphatase
MMEIQCVVSGKVQGVGFRDYAQQAAADLELRGYIQNNPDGSVSVVAQGSPESLRLFVEYLHEGSVLAVVEGVAVEWKTAILLYDDFSIAR